jgi:hypothetical protein
MFMSRHRIIDLSSYGKSCAKIANSKLEGARSHRGFVSIFTGCSVGVEDWPREQIGPSRVVGLTSAEIRTSVIKVLRPTVR